MEIKMRAIIQTFLFTIFLLFSACGGITTNSVLEQNDEDRSTTVKNDGNSDNQNETDEDTDLNVTGDNDTGEYSDADWIFDEPEPDTEHFNLSFRSKPHGVTIWGREYRYPVKCGQENSGDINISIAENDTCKGRLDNTVYIFTPTKVKFPDAVCNLSIRCSDSDTSVTQTTELIIPNPYVFKGIPEKEKIPVKKIVWTDEKGLFFISDKVLFASDINFSQISVVDTNIERYFSTEESLYYVSGNNIYSINSENEPSVIISDEDISKKCLTCTILYFIMVNNRKDILFIIKNDQSYETWLYQSQTESLSVVDSSETYSAYGTANDHIFENNRNLYSFDYNTKVFSEICPGFLPSIDLPYAFFGSKFYYRTMDCGGGSTHFLNIETCETEEIGRYDIKYNPYWNYLFVAYNLHSKDSVKGISNIDKGRNLNFFVEDLESKDGKIAFLPFSGSRDDSDYNCFAVLNYETGEVKLSDRICSEGTVAVFAGFSGDGAVYNIYGNKSGSTHIYLDKYGKTIEINITETRPADFSYFGATTSIDNKDLLFYGNSFNYRNSTKTDGTPGNYLYLGKYYGNPISLLDKELLMEYVDNGEHYIAFYNIENGKRKGITSSSVWASYPRDIFWGIHDYKYNWGGMVFFGVGGYYGDYSIWSTTGPDCSIDHEMHLVHSYTNEYQETFYSSRYLEDYLSTSTEYGAYFQASHFLESKCSKAIPTNLVGKSLGFIGKNHIAYTQINGDITSIFAQSKELTTWTHFPENFYSFLKIINNYIVAVDTASKGGVGGNIVIFKDIEGKSGPVVLELFPLDKYEDVKGLLFKDENAIFSAVDIMSGKIVVKLVTLKDDITIKTLFSTSNEDFHKRAIVGDHFIFSKGDELRSISLKDSSPKFKTLYKAEGTYEYVGSTYSKKAVISHYNYDLPANERKTVIVTDGIKTLSLNTEGEGVSVYKGWIVKKNGIIEENENEELEVIIMEDSVSTEFYTRNNRYYFNTDRQVLNIYHPPSPQYQQD